MPKKTTSKTASESEQLDSTAPVVEKKVKAKATKIAKVETSVSPVETSQDDTVDVSGENETPLAEQSIEFLAKIQQIGALLSSLKTEYKSLEKRWSREVKTAQKQSSKRKRKAGNRAPSGFVKPTKISDELASFLGKEKGTEMARTDVTREINTYIRAHKLQDKDNGRKINPDTKLASLLKLKKTDELTYFNLQKYMSPHFAKAVKVEATTTA
jgi:upstream activation factor subunit UAF30